MNFTVLFENAFFIAADKPAGWLTVPSRMGSEDPRPCLGRELERLVQGQIFPVHRLDADVTGLVLFAKEGRAHKAANLWFEQKMVRKRYEALTEGDPTPLIVGQQYVWKSRILRGKKRAYDSPHGKDSLTHATFLGLHDDGADATFPPALHWYLEPLTGRSHQLRFELSKQTYPILGDTLYGATRRFESPSIAPVAIALRSVSLDFTTCMDAALFELPASLSTKGLL